MKRLEKKVHFVAEGTSVVGCYDSKGNPMKYIIIGGEPFIALDNSDRLLDIKHAKVHNNALEYYQNYRCDFGEVHLKGVVNGRFIGKNCSVWNYAERDCTKRELASFHLAMYRVYKNAMKLEVENG